MKKFTPGCIFLYTQFKFKVVSEAMDGRSSSTAMWSKELLLWPPFLNRTQNSNFDDNDNNDDSDDSDDNNDNDDSNDNDKKDYGNKKQIEVVRHNECYVGGSSPFALGTRQ